MMEDDEIDTAHLLLLVLCRRRRRRRRRLLAKRSLWTRLWIQRRDEKGAYANLIAELREEDPEKYRQFHRFQVEEFRELLEMVGLEIQREDTIMRRSIEPGQRLAVTLRFLASGESFRSLSFHFRIGESTVSKIVDETCQTLYHVMKDKYLKAPNTTEEWEEIAVAFETKWNYPACLGALDGKHIAIKQPDNSGSEFFNYKHFFSVLLLALVDANYKFVFVDVGAPGRAGDAGVYAKSALKSALDADTLNLPEARTLQGFQGKLEHHIIGDDAFPLSTRVMKPHPQRNLDKPKRIFNYRFSRARRVVENAFGILANRFRVFLTTINLGPDKVVQIMLTACCLHNYLIDKNKHTYLSACDVEDNDSHVLQPGSWRKDPQLLDMEGNHFRNPTQRAKQQRDKLTDYFNSEDGSVPWQEDMLQIRKS